MLMTIKINDEMSTLVTLMDMVKKKIIVLKKEYEKNIFDKKFQ